MESAVAPLRIALLVDGARLRPAEARLLDALERHSLPGCHLDRLGAEHPLDADHDVLFLPGPVGAGPLLAETLAAARTKATPILAAAPAVPATIAPGACAAILSPTLAADAELLAQGAVPAQLYRLQPGIDPEAVGPGHFSQDVLPGPPDRINVLHVGAPERPELLADALAAATRMEPRLHLSVVHDPGNLPALYASADLLVHLSTSSEFPLAIAEAQASGMAVIALDGGAAAEIVQDGRDGLLVPPHPAALAQALVTLARRGTLRERLAVGGLTATRSRRWATSLAALHDAWRTVASPARPLLRAA